MEHRTTESDIDMSENEKEKSVHMSSSCHIQIKQTATETVEAESRQLYGDFIFWAQTKSSVETTAALFSKHAD